MYQIKCPKCLTLLQIPETLLGQNVKCTKCGTVLATSAPKPSAPTPNPAQPAAVSPPQAVSPQVAAKPVEKVEPPPVQPEPSRAKVPTSLANEQEGITILPSQSDPTGVAKRAKKPRAEPIREDEDEVEVRSPKRKRKEEPEQLDDIPALKITRRGLWTVAISSAILLFLFPTVIVVSLFVLTRRIPEVALFKLGMQCLLGIPLAVELLGILSLKRSTSNPGTAKNLSTSLQLVIVSLLFFIAWALLSGMALMSPNRDASGFLDSPKTILGALVIGGVFLLLADIQFSTIFRELGSQLKMTLLKILGWANPLAGVGNFLLLLVFAYLVFVADATYFTISHNYEIAVGLTIIGFSICYSGFIFLSLVTRIAAAVAIHNKIITIETSVIDD